MLDQLYEIQRLLLLSMPDTGTPERQALIKLDDLINELEAEA